MNANICHKTFADINIDDIFFQSLKEDYPEFVSWFKRKSTQDAFVQYDENRNISGFLYLKIEEKVVEDVCPVIRLWIMQPMKMWMFVIQLFFLSIKN